MAACHKALTLTPDDLGTTSLHVAEEAGSAVGVAQVAVQDGGAGLEKLFVEPAHIGRGVGRALFVWTARGGGAARMVIESDPAAAPFYRRMGALDAGTAPSNVISGRDLPRLIFTL